MVVERLFKTPVDPEKKKRLRTVPGTATGPRVRLYGVRYGCAHQPNILLLPRNRDRAFHLAPSSDVMRHLQVENLSGRTKKKLA